MNVTVELNFGENKAYSEELLAEIAQETIASSGRVVHADVHITISVAIVDESEIQRVNRELRQKDHITDVISIGDYSDDNNISTEEKKDIFLGEIILCYNYIEQISKEANTNIDQEFFTIYSHGILHLLGFDHGEDMYVLQDRIGEKFSII